MVKMLNVLMIEVVVVFFSLPYLLWGTICVFCAIVSEKFPGRATNIKSNSLNIYVFDLCVVGETTSKLWIVLGLVFHLLTMEWPLYMHSMHSMSLVFQ